MAKVLFIAVLGVAVATAAPASTSIAASAEPGAARQVELRHLLKHDCGSCHGMTRKGGLGSPLLPEVLADRSDADLVSIILDGVPETPMPPWRPLLAPDEVRWLVGVLREGSVER